MKRSLKSIFNQQAFDRIFIRQRDDVSCTPASFATVARLYDLDSKKDYRFFRKQLKTNARGSFHQAILDVCRKHLPVTKTGRYQEGIAIATICHKPEGSFHSVVFLAKKDNTIIYYDPFDHRIYRDKTRNMLRAPSRDQAYKNWTANFEDINGADFSFWIKHSAPNPYPLEKQIFRIKQKRKDAKARKP